MPRLSPIERRTGKRIVRGNYYGTSDDCADSWYIDDIHSAVIDHRGRGYNTKREALLGLALWEQLTGAEA